MQDVSYYATFLSLVNFLSKEIFFSTRGNEEKKKIQTYLLENPLFLKFILDLCLIY